MTHDIVVDSLYEEDLSRVLKHLGASRLVMDKDDPEEPYLTPGDGYLVVRIKDRDPYAFARELERRVSQMRIVKVVDRTPADQSSPEQAVVPGSYAAQHADGLL